MPAPTQPTLWLVRMQYDEAREPVMVRDLDDALRVAEHLFGFFDLCGSAGSTWWLVPTWTARSAAWQARALTRGRHARQDEFDGVHGQIAAGLRPELAPLFDLDADDNVFRYAR
jgi:hypothetical protein